MNLVDGPADFLRRLLVILCKITISILACGAAHAITPAQIAANGSTSYALDTSGTLYGWGDDTQGQLAQNRLLGSRSFVRVGSGYKRVSVGVGHIVAIRNDDSLWSWGWNAYGQLGDGTTQDASLPVRIGDGFESVAAGNGSTYAIQKDGTLWAWGQDWYGTGNNIDVSRKPVQIGSGFSAVVTSPALHSLALGKDGSLWTWGNNKYGQLGVVGHDTCNAGTASAFNCSFTRQQVTGSYTSIAAGLWQSYAVDSHGGLWAWGRNDPSQLGDGTTVDQPSPKKIGDGYKMVSSMGEQSVAALKTDGTLWVWGGYSGPATPAKIGDDFSSISYGGTSGFALKADGALWAFGDNGSGQFGDGSIQPANPSRQVASNVVFMSMGRAGTSSIILADGTLWTSGDHAYGQLGLATVTKQPTPVVIGSGYVSIAQSPSGSVALAIKSDGSLWVWGNTSGYIPSIPSSSTPKRLGGDTGFVAVAAGSGFYLALKSDGSLWGVGSNQWGFLGLGTGTNFAFELALIGQGFAQIAASRDFAAAVTSDGSLWMWGANEAGQLGVVTTEICGIPPYTKTCASRPTLVGLNFASIALGTHSAIGIRKDGTAWGWGDNSAGQLGITTTDRCNEGVYSIGRDVIDGFVCAKSPVQLGSGFTKLASGYMHSLGLKADGALWSWGTGYLGGGNQFSVGKPPSKIGSGHVDIAAAERFSLASRIDGSILSWGDNIGGSLGDGTLARSLVGVLVVNPAADGFLNLLGAAPKKLSPSLSVPFFLSTAGDISIASASVATTTKFNPADQGKPGSVFITATVPTGALGTTAPPQTLPGASDPKVARLAGTTPLGFTLIQRTDTGWQTVVNGQLIPYVSGVLGDQLAAQTILSSTDTSNLKGAEFCVGYGTNAQDMVNNGNIRAVATIPGASTTASCVVGGSISIDIDVVPGWNLLGNPVNQSIAVADKFADSAKVQSVWKWDASRANWQFYAPYLEASVLQSYAASQGYGVLSEIAPGEGYWVSAKLPANLGTLNGAAVNLRGSSLASGWNLVATASRVTPQDFNLTLGTTPLTAGQVPINMTSLWAWDSEQSNWYFYAPSLEASALGQYIQSHGYRDFSGSGKTLGAGAGFWVRQP